MQLARHVCNFQRLVQDSVGCKSRDFSMQDAMDRLNMIGLNSIPAWRQHFGSLSNGQQERCSLALALRLDHSILRHASRASSERLSTQSEGGRVRFRVRSWKYYSRWRFRKLATASSAAGSTACFIVRRTVLTLRRWATQLLEEGQRLRRHGGLASSGLAARATCAPSPPL